MPKKRFDTIFLDRDGTLNPDPGYIKSLDEFTFFPFTFPALKVLETLTDRFCIVSNQSGVGRGWITEKALGKIHEYINSSFAEQGLPLVGIYVCYDLPGTSSTHRKPAIGMFNDAARDHQIDLKRCLMIGDTDKDIIAGETAGMETMLVLTGEGETTLKKGKIHATYTAPDLWEGALQLSEAGK
ncbi:MAG: D-glycero-alpha-D-manno-heptose-1,7-bisphosphate 7-phosphatase [Fidelibacterota bacterium]